jgi:Fic family protein
MPDTDISINERLLRRVERKKRALDDRRPLPVDAVNRLREEIRVAHTYHSDAIEGNTLTLQETKLVIEEGITIGGKTLKEHLEATGNANAFEKLESLSKDSRTIDGVVIQEIHEMATLGWLQDAGSYRTQNVRVMGRKKSPPDFSKVPRLMDKLLKEVAQKETDPIATASFLHHGLVDVHPFSDGNGRVARLIMNLYLMKHGYPPTILRKENRRRYYDYLSKADDGNLDPFANFIAKGVDESLTLFLAIFGGKNELVPLGNLARTSEYSQEYLSLRARQGVLDAVKFGKIWHASKKALEEYKKEHGR